MIFTESCCSSRNCTTREKKHFLLDVRAANSAPRLFAEDARDGVNLSLQLVCELVHFSRDEIEVQMIANTKISPLSSVFRPDLPLGTTSCIYYQGTDARTKLSSSRTVTRLEALAFIIIVRWQHGNLFRRWSIEKIVWFGGKASIPRRWVLSPSSIFGSGWILLATDVGSTPIIKLSSSLLMSFRVISLLSGWWYSTMPVRVIRRENSIQK